MASLQVLYGRVARSHSRNRNGWHGRSKIENSLLSNEMKLRDACLNSCFMICLGRNWHLIAILLFVMCGCRRSKETNMEFDRETATWEQQIQDVQSGKSRSIRFDSQITDREFAMLQGRTELHVLSLSNAPITDASSEVISSLSELQEIRLEKTKLSDSAARKLGQLQGLVKINISDCEFSDSGIESWSELPNLIQLRVGSQKLTDSCLSTIAKIRSLRFLHLIRVPVTDVGLKHLHGMKQLESFYLDGAAASDVGLSELIEALPQLHFHRDQMHLPGDPRADKHD